MGLPGSGKTYLAQRIVKLIDYGFNADKIKELTMIGISTMLELYVQIQTNEKISR